jgi:hypothetical protein
VAGGSGVPFRARLRVTREHTHHHADTMLSYHADLSSVVRASVETAHDLVSAMRKERKAERLGVAADSLNRSLRRSFGATEQWTYEAVVRDGVVFDNIDDQGRIGGFDIARFDEAANLAALWNLCHGRRRLHDGEATWSRYLERRPSLAPIAHELTSDWLEGTDVEVDRRSPTILGEIQFGNWALMYRDVLKVLAARSEIDVDLFLYIVADGTLASMISSGTANYEKFCKDLVGPFANVLTVPTLVVGVDLVDDDVPTLEQLTDPS